MLGVAKTELINNAWTEWNGGFASRITRGVFSGFANRHPVAYNWFAPGDTSCPFTQTAHKLFLWHLQRLRTGSTTGNRAENTHFCGARLWRKAGFRPMR